MTTRQRHSNLLIITFLVLELLIYLSFLYLDITTPDSYNMSSFIKYAGIILCVLFQLLYYRELLFHTVLLRIAIIGTCISDYFLLLTNDSTIGVVCFIFVQMSYMIKLRYENSLCIKTKKQGCYIVRSVFKYYAVILTNTVLVYIILWHMNLSINLLSFFTLIYFQSLLFNVFIALRGVAHNVYRSSEDSGDNTKKVIIRKRMIFAFGMVLFLFCDVNVGLFNLTGYMMVREGLFLHVYHISSVAMWFFYLPSQVLISISEIGE